MIGVQVFGKAKNYKPTWTQNHPWACVGTNKKMFVIVSRPCEPLKVADTLYAVEASEGGC